MTRLLLWGFAVSVDINSSCRRRWILEIGSGGGDVGGVNGVGGCMRWKGGGGGDARGTSRRERGGSGDAFHGENDRWETV